MFLVETFLFYFWFENFEQPLHSRSFKSYANLSNYKITKFPKHYKLQMQKIELQMQILKLQMQQNDITLLISRCYKHRKIFLFFSYFQWF